MIDDPAIRRAMNEDPLTGVLTGPSPLKRETWLASDLARIERYSRQAVHNAANIVGAVRLLRSQPSFVTQAQDNLKSAEADLEIALNAVRKAMEEFSTKPVTA